MAKKASKKVAKKKAAKKEEAVEVQGGGAEGDIVAERRKRLQGEVRQTEITNRTESAEERGDYPDADTINAGRSENG